MHEWKYQIQWLYLLKNQMLMGGHSEYYFSLYQLVGTYLN